jgi:hypothetical protein
MPGFDREGYPTGNTVGRNSHLQKARHQLGIQYGCV